MPNPSKGQTEEEYISICIPEVIADGTAQDSSQAYAVCKSKWDNQSRMRIKELYISDQCQDGCSVQAISLVDSPAVEVDFMYFSKQVKQEINTEKRIITGPAMVPDSLIYRYDDKTGEEFYIYFTKETIRKISEKYLMDNLQSSVTIQHEYPVDDISIVESWLITDPKNDKSNAMGYNELPEGTWMVSLKVNNDEIWNQFVKDGIVKGFSIEGLFEEKFGEHSKAKFNPDMILNEILQILNSVD